MKAAILVDSLAIGGAERQAILCTAELRKLGHEADLVYYRPKVEYTDMLNHLGVVPSFVQGGSFGRRCSRLRDLFREKGYDVVHGFKRSAEVYAALAGTWAGVPRRFGSFRTLYNLGWTYRILHHCLDKLLHGWIVNSEAAANSMSRLTRIPRRKFQVLHNGVSPGVLESSLSAAAARVKLGLEVNAVVVTMVGRLERQKNYPMLLQVAKRVGSAIPHARFLVAGKGSLERELRACALEQGLGDHLKFLGQRLDIGDLLMATDISVLTTDWEGMPNAIIEAMAAGKPIVCTKYDGATEVMTDGENALLSPRNDAETFANHVTRLIRDPSLRSRLGQNAQRHAQCAFSPDAMARKLATIYAEPAARCVAFGKALESPMQVRAVKGLVPMSVKGNS